MSRGPGEPGPARYLDGRLWQLKGRDGTQAVPGAYPPLWIGGSA